MILQYVDNDEHTNVDNAVWFLSLHQLHFSLGLLLEVLHLLLYVWLFFLRVGHRLDRPPDDASSVMNPT